MGVLALGILWVNTCLIAAAALKQRAALLRLKSSLASLHRAKVVQGNGPGGALAALEIEQVGRLVAARVPSIVFHDRAYASRLYGGRLAVEDGAEIEVPASDRAEVWIEDEAFRDAAACASVAAFEVASVDAKKARGFARVVRAPLASGQEVFLGTISPDRHGERPLVTAIDPRHWVARKTTLILAFVLVEIAVAGACTALALHPPLFGTVSTIGGAASLAFFLLVQPLGTKVRDAARLPSSAVRRGAWSRPPATSVADAALD